MLVPLTRISLPSEQARGSRQPGLLSPRVSTAHLFLHPRFQVCDGGCNLSCGS